MLAFTPDGRMLITTQPGRLLVRENGQGRTALDIKKHWIYEQNNSLAQVGAPEGELTFGAASNRLDLIVNGVRFRAPRRPKSALGETWIFKS